MVFPAFHFSSIFQGHKLCQPLTRAPPGPGYSSGMTSYLRFGWDARKEVEAGKIGSRVLNFLGLGLYPQRLRLRFENCRPYFGYTLTICANFGKTVTLHFGFVQWRRCPVRPFRPNLCWYLGWLMLGWVTNHNNVTLGSIVKNKHEVTVTVPNLLLHIVHFLH